MLSLKHLVAALALGTALIVAPMADAAMVHKPAPKSKITHKIPVKAKAPVKHKTIKKTVPAKTVKKAIAGKIVKKSVVAKKPTAAASRLAKQGTPGWKHHPATV